jgi:hypothetical protein
MIKNNKRAEAKQQLKAFEQAFIELLAKFPNVEVEGDIDGNILARFEYLEAVSLPCSIAEVPVNH